MRRADPQLRPKPAKDARYYFNARFYDAERGSFIGRDPKLQFFSPYSYVGNMPLVLVDSDGNQADLIGVEPGSVDYQNAMKVVSPDGKYTIVTHSNREGTGPAIWSEKVQAYRAVSPTALAKIVKSDPSWQRRDVELLVCYGAGWSDAFAKELGVYVTAAPEKVEIGVDRMGEFGYWSQTGGWEVSVPPPTDYSVVPEQ